MESPRMDGFRLRKFLLCSFQPWRERNDKSGSFLVPELYLVPLCWCNLAVTETCQICQEGAPASATGVLSYNVSYKEFTRRRTLRIAAVRSPWLPTTDNHGGMLIRGPGYLHSARIPKLLFRFPIAFEANTFCNMYTHGIQWLPVVFLKLNNARSYFGQLWICIFLEFLPDLPSLKLTAEAHENQWLEDEISFWEGYLQRRSVSVSFREGMVHSHSWGRPFTVSIVSPCLSHPKTSKNENSAPKQSDIYLYMRYMQMIDEIWCTMAHYVLYI